MSRPRVLIVGGGISGLACAYFLSKRGLAPTILERSQRFGGLVETQHTAYGEFESGPDSFIASKTAVAQLAQELGIADRIIGSNDERRRVFIGRKGKLVPMPRGMVMMAPADLFSAFKSPLFGFNTKLRFIRETLRPPEHRENDVTLETFVLDHFGREVLDTVAEPLLTGVYGGDPAQLSVASVLPRFLEYERSQGSLIRAVKHEKRAAPSGSLFQSFAGGMQTLIDGLQSALAGRAELRTGCEALQVEKKGPGWSVETDRGREQADYVILATPAHVAARLLEPALAEPARLLKEIPYSSAILVTFIFQNAPIPESLEGFGFLAPRNERDPIAAATFIATKFPSRLAPGYLAIRCFIVGRQARELAGMNDAAIAAAAQNNLHHWTGISFSPVSVLVHRWPDSMPQYVVGHAARVAAIQAAIANSPGLHLCGNAYTGIGVPDCVRNAGTVSERILTS